MRLPVLRGKPRPYKAGRQMGAALAEVGNILYLLDNREQYLQGVADVVAHELEKVQHQRSILATRSEKR